MNTKLLPFSIKYLDNQGKECEGMVWAYDEKTARSRAYHEGLVPEFNTILKITPLKSEDVEKIAKQYRKR